MIFLISNSIFSYGFTRKNSYVNNTEEVLKYKGRLPTPLSRFIKSSDNKKLCGDIYLSERNYNQKCVAIVIHGYGADKDSVLGFADMYYNKFGFSVLVPDLRGHGESEGNYIGFGWHDSYDILLWCKYLCAMLGDNIKIVLHGVSMGAATTLMTASENFPNVVGAISDCSYSSIKNILKLRIKKDLKIPQFPFINLVDLIMRIRCKYSINDGNVKEEVKKIRCPVLYIHGDADTYIPVSAVYSLYENTNSPKKLYICPDAGHAQSARINPEEYFTRVKDFLEFIKN
jgi:fermentation-respiration switch protein FrsA (DUF1100 family)